MAVQGGAVPVEPMRTTRRQRRAPMNARTQARHGDARFLAADVGGTHTRVGLVRPGAGGRIEVLAHRKYACADHPGLAAILADFIGSEPGSAGVDRVAVACAGVALDDEVVNANLLWPIRLSELRRGLGLRELRFVNDFQAAAHAAQCMNADEATLLTPGIDTAAPGPVLVVGPGTGLGAAVRIPHRGEVVVLPTEAGHTAFAPGTAREIAILHWLQRRGGGTHVATEQAVSGPGLVNLYQAICALDGAVATLRAPAAISAAARAGDPAAAEAVQTFCALLGSVIGDLAVLSSARAVFIAGGIVPQLKDFLPHSAFHARLLDKGVMRAALERVPVRLIENDRLGVIGAASWYLEHAHERPSAPVGDDRPAPAREDTD